MVCISFMSKKGNWKFKLICQLGLVVLVLFFVKTKTGWLDEDGGEGKGEQKNEAYYIAQLADELGGDVEVRVTGGRADIVTDVHAIEVEWASKWKNAIGQALWYGLETDRVPRIILLMKNKKKEYKYFLMLNSALQRANIELETDFREVK